jgi:hypothetical protein
MRTTNECVTDNLKVWFAHPRKSDLELQARVHEKWEGTQAGSIATQGTFRPSGKECGCASTTDPAKRPLGCWFFGVNLSSLLRLNFLRLFAILILDNLLCGTGGRLTLAVKEPDEQVDDGDEKDDCEEQEEVDDMELTEEHGT